MTTTPATDKHLLFDTPKFGVQNLAPISKSSLS